MKTTFQRIIGYNLLLMLLIGGGAALWPGGINDRTIPVIFSCILFAVMFVVNVGLAVFTETKEERRAHLLSSLLVLLIGLGNCAVQLSI